MDSVRDQKADALALDILHLARNTLMVRFRFLDRGLGQLDFLRTDRVLFGTDGRHILYDPWHILNVYREDSDAVTHDLLHSLLHLVYRHPFVGADIDRELWGLSCDIAVEQTLLDLGLHTAREAAQYEILTLLTQELGTLTAERIHHFLSQQTFGPAEFERWQTAFAADQHGPWFGMDEDAAADSNMDLEIIWQDISRRMQTELENFSENGNILAQQLRALNRPRQSLTAFLRRFGRAGEIMHISEEEFDLNYYTYGLSLYGSIPLVEPLEYREDRLIRDFVIAIDTSGSVRGEVVQSFVQYAYDILSQRDSFFSRTNLHIIQCDDRIREDVKITCPEDFEAYISNMIILGLGETDFRPVFRRVEELLSAGEFSDLRGLLYFTDGKGAFPAQKPPFETALVLHTDGFEEPPVPLWAMKMTITEDEILEHKFD
ncbi:MAG: VWA-like domain-containing protein [Clostridia bacterium]|nr:VWA-like domain-containing protein [Clostridia bacterium]